ncbi:MAG: two-component regulator propeller domain-containing protein, partial [Pseudoxanthomonas sp.]
WVKTRHAEVARRNGSRFQPWVLDGVAGGNVRDMIVDRDGNFWIGSGTEGLLRHRDGKTSRFSTTDGLSSNAVFSVYEDRDGNLWVGTTSGGLHRFRDGGFTTYAKEEGLAGDQAYSVLEDRAGDVWVSTSEGLNRLRDGQIEHIRVEEQGWDTWALRERRWDSNLLVGTSNTGVLELKEGRLTQMLSERNGIPAYHISGILDDAAHNLWVATRGGGLARVSDGRTTLYTRAQGLNSDSLYSLAESTDGALWIGSDTGLNRLKDGRISNQSRTGNLAGAVVLSLFPDSRGALWIGTFGRGLFRLENGRLTQYTTHQGLLDDTVNSIIEDAASNLWIGTDHVVARLARHELDAVAAGSRASLTPTAFGKADGMKSAETTGGTYPAAWRARDGRLWFPTNRGVVVVDPAQPSFPVSAPRARIEEMFADEARIDSLQAVSLPAGTRRLEIHYTAPNLSSPERTQFRYRLDGFDDEWVLGGTQRVANYTNLSPGQYSFRVSARIENGDWDTQEATLGFGLAPQFWQTWWFRLLCVLAALSLVWAIYRLRVGWLYARAAVMEERQRIGSEIHDSLAQGLSGIIFQTEAALLDMPPGIASTRVTSARDLAKSSLDDARYSVWELSPPVLDQKDLAESIPSMARQLSHGQVDDLEINFSGKPWTTRPEANHHLVMITQEAVSNAIQHGHARTIVIRLAYETNALHLSVADNGRGFTPVAAVNSRERGYGMRNMRHRAAALGGTLDFFSELGEGTRISLRIPRAGRFQKVWRLLLGKSVARVEA